jgi:hypothetical protein
MFNPKMDGKGYDKTIHERRIEQLSSEGALDKDIFPTPFGPDYNK